MNGTKQATDLHDEIAEWKNMISLVRDELKGFNSSLEDVAKKTTSSDVKPYIEHFQNQFIRQNEVSDELFHDLKQVDKAVKLRAEGVEESEVDHLIENDQAALRDRTESYQRIFNELKSEYNSFLTKYKN